MPPFFLSEASMLVINKGEVKKILVTELGYSSFEANIYLRDYPSIHDELVEVVQKWLEDRTITDINVFGLSLVEYMRNHRAHFLMAVRDFNRLFDNDLTSERRERLIGIMHKPVIIR
jgi:hypothetical protein